MLLKKTIDPKRELPSSADDILDICTGGVFYEGMYISKTVYINLMIIGSNGVFTFSAIDDEKTIHDKTRQIQKYFSISHKALFSFYVTDEKCFVTNPGGSIVECEDIFECFENLYTNLSRPEIDRHFLKMDYLADLIKSAEIPEEYKSDNDLNGRTYVHEGVVFTVQETYEREDDGDAEYVVSIVPQAEADRIADMASKIVRNDFPDATYRIDEEGQEWILKDSSVHIKGIDTGFIGEKKWFRLSDRDPEKMFLITILGGFIGLHKIAVGNIASFLVYLLTCGGFGMLTALDVLQFLTGSAGYTQVDYTEDENGDLSREKSKFFYKPLKHKWLAVAGACLSLIITLIAARYIYMPVMGGIMNVLAGSAANMDEETLEHGIQIFNNALTFGKGN